MSSFCVSKPMLSFQECLSITDIWTEFPIGSDSEDFKVKQRYSISFLALTPAPCSRSPRDAKGGKQKQNCGGHVQLLLQSLANIT